MKSSVNTNSSTEILSKIRNLAMPFKLENFIVICPNCQTEATLEEESNNACGDPECCGDYEEWVVATCPVCGVYESIKE